MEDRRMCQTQEKSRGRGKVQLLANWGEIEAKLQAGNTIKSIYDALPHIDVCYTQFYRLVKKANQKTFSSLPSRSTHPKSFTPSPHLRQEQSSTAPSRQPPQTFRHDPLPSRDYFAKGGGS
jgi:hypothetical protein